MSQVKEGIRHDKEMVQKGGKSSEDIRKYRPCISLQRQYAQGAGVDVLSNIQMEMGMAMNALTGCNKGIEAGIKEVQQYIGSVHERESLLLEVLSEEGINSDAAKRQSMMSDW